LVNGTGLLPANTDPLLEYGRALLVSLTIFDGGSAKKRAKCGSGMVVEFRCGKDRVFHAGTTEWLVRCPPAAKAERAECGG
jgi:hypothetical protein